MSTTTKQGEAAAAAAKPKGKLAMYWAASCGGCEISVLGIDDKILDVSKLFDVVFWPCVADGKVRDVERLEDGAIDVCLFNGGIRTSEQEYMAQLLRRKSKVLIAFGSCATEGCIPGLANLHSRKEIFDNSYAETCSTENPQGLRPQTETEVDEGTLHLPVFYDTLKTLDQTVDVDYYLPGCPPESPRIWEAHGGHHCRAAAAQGFGHRLEHHGLRFLCANAHGKEDQSVQADLGGHPGSRYLPAGTRPHLLRESRREPAADACAPR